LSFGFLSFLRLASDYNNPAVNKKRNQTTRPKERRTLESIAVALFLLAMLFQEASYLFSLANVTPSLSGTPAHYLGHRPAGNKFRKASRQ